MSSAGPPLASPPKPQVAALKCPSCGAPISLRSFQQAVTVVCDSCHCILDAKDPNLQILQRFQAVVGEVPPLIPLGSRGKLRGTDFEVIGFMRRSIVSEGVRYDWHEYLLFNPYKGFRYLTEYQGHWNDIVTCKDLPAIQTLLLPRANYLGEMYTHFQTAEANTNYVIGEFPWQVRVGERAVVTDYVRPPRVLSSEQTGSEVNWSIGEYTYGADVWKAFNLKGQPPTPVGVYENQPAAGNVNLKAAWLMFIALAAFLIVLMVAFDIASSQEPVFTSNYQLKPGEPKGEASFVTDVFTLKGRTADVQVKTSANVSNSWIYLNYALINEDSGQGWDFGREVSYYSGSDSDGSWTEGSRSDSVIVPSVPPGRYFLRIEPETATYHQFINYSVTVKRDVPVPGFFGIALIALLLPVLALTWRSISFERARWAESDHQILQTGSD